MRSVKKENNIETINDVFNFLSGVFDVFNLSGEEVDDLKYSDNTEVKDVILVDGEYYQVILNI